MTCPGCQNEVEVSERNYGALFTCPRCQAVYFVNFDGQPEYSNDAELSVQNENLVVNENINVEADQFIPIVDFLTFQEASQEVSAFQNVAQEISNFGNSEVQITALNYTLEINGLDSKEDVKAFQETITDSRFGWDVPELLKQIKNGHIVLDKLNPVQAFVLYKRIYFLNFDLKWKQNVLG